MQHPERGRLANRLDQLDRVLARRNNSPPVRSSQFRSRHLAKNAAHLRRGEFMPRFNFPSVTHGAAQVAPASEIHHDPRRGARTAEPGLRQAGDHASAPTQPFYPGDCGLHVSDSDDAGYATKVPRDFANGIPRVPGSRRDHRADVSDRLRRATSERSASARVSVRRPSPRCGTAVSGTVRRPRGMYQSTELSNELSDHRSIDTCAGFFVDFAQTPMLLGRTRG